jgi:hypothetical protein
LLAAKRLFLKITACCRMFSFYCVPGHYSLLRWTSASAGTSMTAALLRDTIKGISLTYRQFDIYHHIGGVRWYHHILHASKSLVPIDNTKRRLVWKVSDLVSLHRNLLIQQRFVCKLVNTANAEQRGIRMDPAWWRIYVCITWRQVWGLCGGKDSESVTNSSLISKYQKFVGKYYPNLNLKNRQDNCPKYNQHKHMCYKICFPHVKKKNILYTWILWFDYISWNIPLTPYPANVENMVSS